MRAESETHHTQRRSCSVSFKALCIRFPAHPCSSRMIRCFSGSEFKQPLAPSRTDQTTDPQISQITQIEIQFWNLRNLRNLRMGSVPPCRIRSELSGLSGQRPIDQAGEITVASAVAFRQSSVDFPAKSPSISAKPGHRVQVARRAHPWQSLRSLSRSARIASMS